MKKHIETKPIFIILGMLFVAMFIPGCSSKTCYIKDVVELKDELPTCIIIHFDDPSFEPKIIETIDDIALIVEKLNEQKLHRVETESPAPRGNTFIELHYSDGSTLKLGAIYIRGTNGKLYEVGSFDLTAFLESFKLKG